MFYAKNIFLKIFYNGKYFTPKQTEHKNANHFSKLKNQFWSNRKYFQFDCYFQSHQILENTKNIFQKLFYVETNGALMWLGLRKKKQEEENLLCWDTKGHWIFSGENPSLSNSFEQFVSPSKEKSSR
jgi:hypothetical protein